MNVEKSSFFCLKSDSFLSRSRFTRDWGMLKDYFLIPPLWDSAKLRNGAYEHLLAWE